jgi:hypothetical protein
LIFPPWCELAQWQDSPVVGLTPEELAARRAHIDRVGRRLSTGLILLGVVLTAMWVLTGFAWGWIPGPVAAAGIGPSLVLVAMGIGVRVAMARSRRRGIPTEETTAQLRESRARRMHRLAIGNSVAAVIVVAGVWILVPGPWAAAISVLMVIGAADTWYLRRRLRP